MKDELKLKLVHAFREKDPNSTLTYAEWVQKREADWKTIITHSLPELTCGITNDNLFFDTLVSKGVFNKRTLENYKVRTGRCAQISAILDGLSKRPFGDFVKFCAVLLEIGQGHIIANLMTPEVKNQPSNRQPNTNDNGTKTENDAIPANDASEHRDRVDFDWRKAIKLNLTTLMDTVDPDNGLLLKLREADVISTWNYDIFESASGRSNRVAKILDYIMTKRPDKDFIKLCKALKETKQEHIVRNFLSPEGVQTAIAAQRKDRVDGPNAGAAVMENLELIPNWKPLLVHCHSDLVNELEVSFDVISKLLKLGVINSVFRDILKEEPDIYARADKLLDYMHRRSDEDFARFRKALNEEGQGHIVKKYLDIPDERSSVAVSDECPEGAENAALLCPTSLNRITQPSDTESPPHTIDTQLQRMSVDEGNEDVTAAAQEMEVTGSGDAPGSAGIQETAENPIDYEMQQSDPVDEQNVQAMPAVAAAVVAAAVAAANTDEDLCEQHLVADTAGPVFIERVLVRKCKQEFYNEKKEDAYAMSKAERGRCLIFNMEQVSSYQRRIGTQVDGSLLVELFTQLHFHVEQFMDFTARQVKDKVREVSSDKSLKNDQCLVLFVMSHGTTKEIDGKRTDCMFGSDGQPLTPDDLLVPFSDKQCKYLKNKPRLAFFQACRGDNFDQMDAMSEEAQPPATETDFMPRGAPSYPDFLIGYPTQSSFRSFRNTERGSWYVNGLVRIFMQYAATMDVCAMLQKLNGEVSKWNSDTGSVESSNKTQVANFVSHFRRPYFFFFPGIQH